MNQTLSKTIIISLAITAVTILACIDLLRGGDGATIVGAFTVISGLVGYEFGIHNPTDNITQNT